MGVEPAPTDERMRRIIAAAATSLGLTHKLMPSGAGHDAQDLAHIAPTGMIFVPSVGGVSHSPKEYTFARRRHQRRERALANRAGDRSRGPELTPG